MSVIARMFYGFILYSKQLVLSFIYNQSNYILKLCYDNSKNEFFFANFHCETRLWSNYNILELCLFSLLWSESWLLLALPSEVYNYLDPANVYSFAFQCTPTCTLHLRDFWSSISGLAEVLGKAILAWHQDNLEQTRAKVLNKIFI